MDNRQKPPNYYQVLGLTQRASLEQIRRAYRILARRYHPDVNPSPTNSNSPDQQNVDSNTTQQNTNSETPDNGERFRLVAEAYRVLSDGEQRKKYDDILNYEGVRAQAFQAYERAQDSRRRESTTRGQRDPGTQQTKPFSTNKTTAQPGGKQPSLWTSIKSKLGKKKLAEAEPRGSISIVELPITFEEAAFGCKKPVLVPSGSESAGSTQSISVIIPKATKDGALIRAKDKKNEYLCLIRVARHSGLTLNARGLIAELPVTIREVLLGAIITAPGVYEENEITVMPGSQSGTEIRLEKKGLTLDNAERGDLIYRLIVNVPTCHAAVGIAEAVETLERYRETAPRQTLGSRLLANAAAN